MASNIPVIVQGNSFSLAIPLQIYYINGGQMDLEDYTPDPTDEVSVQLKGSRRNYTYTPTIDGNVANIDLSGNELADNYSVVVSIVKANGQRLRSFRTDQFFIVESSDDLTPSDIIEGLEENVIYLNSSIFVAGEDGRGIESIVKTSTSGLVDTYTITLSNGETSTFDVTNGKDGVDLGLATIVNNLTTGGASDVLSAEMGKRIAQTILGGEGVRETIPCNSLCIKGAYYNNKGVLTTSNQYKYTEMINLTNVLRLDVTGSFSKRVWYFGSDKTTIKGNTTTNVVLRENFPADSAYCAISYAVNATNDILIDYNFSSYIFDVQNGMGNYTKMTLPVGRYSLDATTGEQSYNTSFYGILGYIPLFGATSIYIPSNNANQGIICFYGDSHNFIAGYTYAQYHIVPSGAKYAKVRTGSSALTSVDVYLYHAKNTPLLEAENNSKKIGNVSPRLLTGKKVAFLGDSITSASVYGLYVNIFATISGATITNHAVAGKCYASDEIAGQASNLVGDEDVVVVMGGTNDFGLNKAIGDIYTESGGSIVPTTDSTTMCGGLHDAIQAIYTKCPTAQVVIITPPQKSSGWTKNNAGKYLYEYVDAIKDVAKLYGIPVVDQFANCGINPVMSAMKSKYFNNDGTHPKDIYHTLLAQWLYNAIATWVKEPYA